MADYPGTLPSFQAVTGSDTMDDGAKSGSAIVGDLQAEVVAIATELGTDPSGASSSVKARLDALDTTVAGKAAASHGHAAGDVSGLATVATTGAYSDLSGKPTLGTAAAAATTDFDPAGSAAAAQAAAIAASQPLDSDLTAIAALTTTAYGRAFLGLADAAAGRTALALGTAATSASGDFEAAGAVAAHTGDTTDAHDASAVSVDASAFAGNLSGTDTDVQTALDTIDGLALGGGGGSLEVADESSTLSAAATKLTFVGGGVRADEPATDEVRVTVSRAFQWDTMSRTGAAAAPPPSLGGPGDFAIARNTSGAPAAIHGPKGLKFLVSTHRASLGTTKTITTADPHGLAVGDLVGLVNTPNANYAASDQGAVFTSPQVPVTAVTSTTFSYTGSVSSTESTTASTTGVYSVLRDTLPITNRASSGTTRTMTTSCAHGLLVGEWVRVKMDTPNTSYDGEFVVASVPSTTTFTYTKSGSLTESTAATGRLTIGYPVDGAAPLSSASAASGMLRIPSYPASATLGPSPGGQVIIDSALPTGWSQSNGSNTFSVTSSQWGAASASGVSGAYLLGGLYSASHVNMTGVLEALPTSTGLAWIGNTSSFAFGVAVVVDASGYLYIRACQSGTNLATSASGAVVAGDVILYERRGHLVTAKVIRGNAVQATIEASAYNLPGTDAYLIPTNIGFGVKDTTTAKWKAGLDLSGQGTVQVWT